jgi:hypothetical protein
MLRRDHGMHASRSHEFPFHRHNKNVCRICTACGCTRHSVTPGFQWFIEISGIRNVQTLLILAWHFGLGQITVRTPGTSFQATLSRAFFFFQRECSVANSFSGSATWVNLGTHSLHRNSVTGGIRSSVHEVRSYALFA